MHRVRISGPSADNLEAQGCILLVIESEVAVCEAWWPVRRASAIKRLARHCEVYAHRSSSAAAIPPTLGVFIGENDDRASVFCVNLASSSRHRPQGGSIRESDMATIDFTSVSLCLSISRDR